MNEALSALRKRIEAEKAEAMRDERVLAATGADGVDTIRSTLATRAMTLQWVLNLIDEQEPA